MDSGLQEWHQKRLEECGGWRSYLYQYRIFIPHVIRLRGRRLQVYTACAIGLLLGGRIFKLGPQLLGKIIDRTAELGARNQVPWRKIMLFIFAIKIPQDVEQEMSFGNNMLTAPDFWSFKQLQIGLWSHARSLSREFHKSLTIAEIQATQGLAESLNRVLDSLVLTTIPTLLDYIVAFGYLSYLFDVCIGSLMAFIWVSYVIMTYKITFHCANWRRDKMKVSIDKKKLEIEGLTNLKGVTCLNRQRHQQSLLEEKLGAEIYGFLKLNNIQQIRNVGQSLIITLGYEAVLLLALYQVVENERPVGSRETLPTYWIQLTCPIYPIVHTFREISGYMADSKPLLQIVQTKPTVPDTPGAPDLEFGAGREEHDSIAFSYEKCAEFIRNLNFMVEPGNMVAFVGQTGSGKTTIYYILLFRFHIILEGRTLIDGQDPRDVTQETIRETTDIVLQNLTSRNTTILEAVRHAHLNATDGEVYEAYKVAAIHDKIMGMPNRYLSQIDDRSARLSNGERQRLAIAQIILRNPKIVVLDEARSAANNITESETQGSLAQLYKGLTTFVIANRRSTVIHADQIFVLDNGTIVETGKHHGILHRQDRYWQLWTKKM
ncbi:P-loop containing nucleoside triphosphate hydrolase protein, partial [Lojkania enalia]